MNARTDAGAWRLATSAAMYLRALFQRSGLTLADAATRCGVAPRTLRGYLDRDQAPPAVAQLLTVLAGQLPWRGAEHWQYIRGRLYYRDNPDGIALDDLPAYRFKLLELDATRRELDKLRAAPAQYLLDLDGD